MDETAGTSCGSDPVNVEWITATREKKKRKSVIRKTQQENEISTLVQDAQEKHESIGEETMEIGNISSLISQEGTSVMHNKRQESVEVIVDEDISTGVEVDQCLSASDARMVEPAEKHPEPAEASEVSMAEGSGPSASGICKGGPGREVCGKPVDEGVQCKCNSWFHVICQKIPKPAVTALKKYQVLSWLCDKCKPTVGAYHPDQVTKLTTQLEALEKTIREQMKLVGPQLITQNNIHSLERKVENLDASVQKQVKMVESSMKEQEKAVDDQVKLLKRSFVDQTSQKRLLCRHAEKYLHQCA